MGGPRRRNARRLLAATMIGAATIFAPKIDPTEHWSTTPIAEVTVAAVAAIDAAGQPAVGAGDGALGGAVVPPVRRRGSLLRLPFPWRRARRPSPTRR